MTSVKTSMLILLFLGKTIQSFSQQYVTYDLKYPVINWQLASTPQNSPDSLGNILFLEANLTNDLRYGYNRAKLAWYNIDPLFTRNNSATPDHIRDSPQQKNAYVREVPEEEVFPDSSNLFFTNLLTFDLAYYPDERGPYNYENSLSGSTFSDGLNPDGTLKQPSSRWGGIMRDLDQTDFESYHIRNIVFWLLDPFIYDTASSGGSMYIQIGNISEDILKDGQRFHENALDTPRSSILVDTTNWGIIPFNQLLTPTFDNDVSKRQYQDIGLDGLNDESEVIIFNSYLINLQSFLSPPVMDIFLNDPSGDNYHYYRGDDYDSEQRSILERYKKYNGTQGNSPASSSGQTVSEAATYIPDSEDLNWDNTLNETEEYFQYRIPITPGMQVGSNYFVDKITNTIELDVGAKEVSWYQFKIPVDEFGDKVGNIPDFRSIRFMRVFLTGFEEPVVLRFAEFALESTDTVSAVINNHQNQLGIYPNPNNGKFTLELNNADVIGIYVYNSLGQLIEPLGIVITGNKVELDIGQQRGLYFIRIQTGNGFINSKVFVR